MGNEFCVPQGEKQDIVTVWTFCGDYCTVKSLLTLHVCQGLVTYISCYSQPLASLLLRRLQRK